LGKGKNIMLNNFVQVLIEELLNDARRHIDFVLNQSAHDSTQPAFESELQAAYNVVQKLKRYIEMG
jgi:hypothetical protein